MPSLLNLKYSLRSLKQNKFTLFINILGFSVSLAFVIMIGLYVQKEYSVDSFHKDKERIFMLEAPSNLDNRLLIFPYGFMDDLLLNFPQIETGARVMSSPVVVSVPNGDKLNVPVMFADEELFDILSIEFKVGNAATALSATDDVIISESFARTYFGEQSPIGQTVRLDMATLNVSGVIKDIKNSHISDISIICNADYLANSNPSFAGYRQWIWGFYLKGKVGSNLKDIEADVSEYAKDKVPNYSNVVNGNLSFRPLEDLYLAPYSSLMLSVLPYIQSNSPEFIAVMLLVAVIILAFAGINYLNLSVAQSGFRAKSTAIQRLLGSAKREVFWSFIAESIGVLLISGAVATFLAWLAFPWFGSLMSMRMSFADEFSWMNTLMIAVVVLFMGTVAGWVPAAVISGFKPIEVTRGTFRRKTKNVYSKILITLQYAITIILLGCTVIITQQIRFMQSSDKGFNPENLIVCSYHPHMISRDATPLINKIKNIPGVVDAMQCAEYPMKRVANNSRFKDKDGVDHTHTLFYVDSSFISVLGMKIKSINTHNPDGYWINETAAKQLGIAEDAVVYNGADGYSFAIRGVLKDFNYTDFTSPIGAVEMRPLPKTVPPRDIIIKISGENRAATLSRIRDEYNKMAGGDIFDGQFMTDLIASYYKTQTRLSNLLGLLSFIAIVISSMGMLAMSIYFTRQRARDMAVRKVFGATPQGVLGLLMGGFLKLVGVAFVIAVPIIYLLMQEWLSGYVYRIRLTPVPFLIAGGIVLVIAVLTVVGHSVKVAVSNPVDSLKAE